MRCVLLWTHLSLLLVLILDSTHLTASYCPNQHCGNISIRYPFGIGKGCYLNGWFEIQCNNSTSGKLVPYLPKINKEVVRIYLPTRLYGSLRIKTNITSMGCSNSSNGIKFGEPLNFTGTPFTIGRSNIFQAIGCNYKATLTHLEPRLVGCIATCDPRKKRDFTSCNGYKCCHADPPSGIGEIVGIDMEDISSNIRSKKECGVAFLTDEYDSQVYPHTELHEPQWFYDRQYVILQLRWAIPMTNLSFIKSLGCVDGHLNMTRNYNIQDSCTCYKSNDRIISIGCVCGSGYTGNPYILGGCKDIDECLMGASTFCSLGYGGTCVNTPGSFRCVHKKDKTLPVTIGLCAGFGVLILFGVTLWLYKFIKKRRKIKRKKKFFKRNGGLLLKQQLTPTEGNIEKTKVFDSKELEKATENFSLNRVLGQGGQGTVYKGMLLDGRIVAIKKSKLVDEDKLEEFINEVVILSQINHRNIVKLIGCCLETEVPLLVYDMREVSMELERIRSPIGDSQSHVQIIENNQEEVAAELIIGVESCHNVGVTAPAMFQDNAASSSWLDAEPLFPRQTW
ncbi:hypothetical protein AALP_AA1G045500 [Arabis alpina]|uniref:Protein kinase domain-containing protein n=1 Tax=Arabis alpina TaxID=50452 RepID=A0A087HL35_ARAAL|nr:hypothetical protein AALP_AA1G045500 [Arabis alpina]